MQVPTEALAEKIPSDFTYPDGSSVVFVQESPDTPPPFVRMDAMEFYVDFPPLESQKGEIAGAIMNMLTGGKKMEWAEGEYTNIEHLDGE